MCKPQGRNFQKDAAAGNWFYQNLNTVMVILLPVVCSMEGCTLAVLLHMYVLCNYCAQM